VPDAASPTWDQIVDRVSVQSNYLMLVDSARRWSAAFQEMETVRRKLLSLAVESADQWRGDGGAAFQEHVRALAETMKTIHGQHKAIAAGLGRVAEHLRQAVMSIPIPSWRYAEVQNKQAAFARYGVPPHLEPSLLYQAQHWAAPSTDGLIEGRFNLWWDEAQAAYRRLESAYQQELDTLPKGTSVTPPGVRTPGPGQPGPGQASRPGGAAKTSGLNPLNSGAGLPSSGLQTPMSTAGLPTSAMPNTHLPNLSTATPPDLSGLGQTPPLNPLTGLPDPAKSGLAGIGKLGGIGAGGGIGGLPGLGPAADLPGSVTAGFSSPGALGTPRLNAAGVAGAGGLAGGVGGGGMYPPMMPMGGQGGQGGPGGTADSMLHEDEIKAMFGFEADRSEPEPDIPRSGVLEA